MKTASNRPKLPILPSFMPRAIAKSLTDVQFQKLAKAGITHILIDLDGTVVEKGLYEVSPGITKCLRAQPLKIYIATNRPKSRDLKNLKELLHADGVVHPVSYRGKPFKAYYRGALRTLGVKPEQVAMIGDRLLQDVWGANRSGIYSILVERLGKPANFFDKLLDTWEKLIIKAVSHYYS